MESPQKIKIPTLEDLAEILLNEKQIQTRVNELAKKIFSDYLGKELILITVLKGANTFAQDLIKYLHQLDSNSYFPEKGPLLIQDYVMLSRYQDDFHPTRDVQVILGPDPHLSLHQRNILIIEDIIDQGLTMRFLLNHLQKENPFSLKICSLLRKPPAKKANFPIDYLGFDIPDKFVVGYGLDYKQYRRQWPFIAVLKPEFYQA